MSSSSDSLFFSLPIPLQQLIDEVFTSLADPNAVSNGRKNVRSGAPDGRTPVPSSSTSAVTGGGFIIDDIDNESSKHPSGGGGFIIDDAPPGGGFIVDDTTFDSGGGFITENATPPRATRGSSSERKQDTSPSQIPFSLIPSALYRLDLPGDDREILGVFRNAAGGWASSSVPEPPSSISDDANSANTGEPRAPALYVDRSDWRSVCAVLLENRAADFRSVEPEAPLRQRRQRPARSGRATGASSDADVMDIDEEEDDVNEDDEDDEDMSDIYVEDDAGPAGSDGDFQDEGSDDEFLPGTKRTPTRPSRGKKAQAKRSGRDSSGSPPARAIPGKPTRRQREDALEAFSLFFTSRNDKDKAAGLVNIPKEDIPNQRIKISQLQAAATLLGEKLKAEDMVDMLDMFSTAPDKSMSLDDFTRMMITTKMI